MIDNPRLIPAPLVYAINGEQEPDVRSNFPRNRFVLSTGVADYSFDPTPGYKEFFIFMEAGSYRCGAELSWGPVAGISSCSLNGQTFGTIDTYNSAYTRGGFYFPNTVVVTTSGIQTFRWTRTGTKNASSGSYISSFNRLYLTKQ